MMFIDEQLSSDKTKTSMSIYKTTKYGEERLILVI